MPDGFTPAPEDLDEIRRRLKDQETKKADFTDQSNVFTETENPDDAAYDLRKSAELGIPREAIGGARDEYKAEDTLRKMQEMRERAPRTSEWLSAPENYAVARDEADQLGALERAFITYLDVTQTGKVQQAVSSFGPAMEASMAGVALSSLEAPGLTPFDAAIVANLDKVRGLDEAGAAVDRVAGAVRTPKMPSIRNPFAKAKVRVPEAVSQFPATLSRARDRASANALDAAMSANARLDAARPKGVTPESQAILSGIGSMTEMGPALAAGFLTRSAAAPTAIMGRQVYGQAYIRGREEGLSPGGAALYAGAQSGIERATERLGLEILFGKDFVGKSISKRLFASLSVEQVQEQFATLGQDFVDWQALNQEKTFDQFLEERGPAAYQTAIATLVASAPTNAAVLGIEKTLMEMGRLEADSRPSEGQRRFSEILDKVSASKLAKRSPEKMTEYVGKLTEGTAVETMIVDLDGVVEALEQAGVDPVETLEALGVDGYQAMQNWERFGEIEVKTSTLVTSPAMAAHRAAIEPHVRATQDAATPAQKEVLKADFEAALKDGAAQIQDALDTGKTTAEKVTQVRESLKARILGAGMDTQGPQLEAKLDALTALLTTLPQRTGQDVLDFYAARAPKIQGVMEGEVMEEADVLPQAQSQGYEGQDKGEAASWLRGVQKFGPEGMTTEARMARAKEQGFDTDEVFYHGTGDLTNFSVGFDPNMTGLGNDQLGSGFYFTNQAETASGYTTRRLPTGESKLGGEDAPGVLPVVLNIKNPIVLENGTDMLSQKVEITAEQAEAIIRQSPLLAEDVDNNPLGNWHDIWSEGVQDWMIGDVASSYEGNTILSIENDFFKGHAEAFRRAVRDVLGYDGVIQKFDNGEVHKVAWFPEQVRSVHAAFDPDQSDSADLLGQELSSGEMQTLDAETQEAIADPETDVLPLTDDMQVMELDEFLAFHGTLAKFDKFETDKIGAGEGAQAFGPGHYFTQSRGIADWYRKRMKTLSPGIRMGKEAFNKANPAHFALAEYWKYRDKLLHYDLFGGYKSLNSDRTHAGALEGAISSLQYEIDQLEAPFLYPGGRGASDYAAADRPIIRDRRELIAFLKQGLAYLETLDPDSSKGIPKPRKPVLRGGGNIYTVSVKLPAEQTIQYDKPFGQQSPAVQKAFREAAEAGHLGKAGPALEKYGDATRMDVLVAALKNMKSPAMDAMRANDIRGVRYLDGMSRGKKNRAGQSYNYVVFNDGDVKILDREGKLFQMMDQQRRGQYAPRTDLITLFEQADVTTLMHEAAHWYLETLYSMSVEPDAHPFVVEQYEAIRKWGKVGPDFRMYDDMGRLTPEAIELHESFAETFEVYLQTGKAPSASLRQAFQAFKKWITQLWKRMYGGGQPERANLNPEIVAVMDRMLAVDEEIDAQVEGIIRSAEQQADELLKRGIITKRQRDAAIMNLETAREGAKEDLMARLMEAKMREDEAWWNTERARVRRDVLREFDKSPVGRALSWLGYGQWKGDVPSSETPGDAADVEMFQRGEQISEAQAVASREFDDEADRIFEESEFRWDMLDDEMERIMAPIDAKLEYVGDTDLVQIAEDAKEKFLNEGIEALDPNDVNYDDNLAFLEEQAEGVYQEAYDKAEAEAEAEAERLQEERDQLADSESLRLEEEAIKQIEEYRTRAITELVDRFEEKYGAAALLNTKYEEYSGYDSRDRYVLSSEGELLPIEEFFEDGEETLPQRAYHGTQREIIGVLQPSPDGLLGPGINLAKQPGKAKAYAGENGQVYIVDFDETRLATYAQWKAARSQAGREMGAGRDRAANKLAVDRLTAEGFIGVDAGDTVTIWSSENIAQRKETLGQTLPRDLIRGAAGRDIGTAPALPSKAEMIAALDVQVGFAEALLADNQNTDLADVTLRLRRTMEQADNLPRNEFLGAWYANLEALARVTDGISPPFAASVRDALASPLGQRVKAVLDDRGVRILQAEQVGNPPVLLIRARMFEGDTLGQSAAPLQSRPIRIQGTGPGGRVLNWDLGMAFTERHMKKYGRALDPADPADYAIILKSMLQDFKEQSAQQDTGDAWYTDDINEAIALTSQIYPELNTSPQFRDLFLTVTALLSPQQKPVQNWENAILAMRSWRETGRIEFLKPSGKQYGVLSHTTGLKMFQHLIDTIGLQAALQWVQTEHTGREIAEMRMASGLFSPIDKATGKVSTKVKDYLASETNLNESVLGIYGFGPKVGDFMQNSVGIDQNAVTVDLWLARTYNRLIGRLTDVSPAQAEAGGIASEIRGRAEREHIKRLVRDAAKKAGLDPSAMQAALWYFEQRLYRSHGIKSDSQNFSGAARTALQKRAIDVRSSESNQRVESADAGEGVLGGGDGRGGDRSGSYSPLPGAPRNLQGPIAELVAVAERYARANGIPLRRQAEYAEVDPERAARIAQAYEDMQHAPNDPAVQEAYADLIRQTRAQYDALVEAGYVFTFFDGASDPYAGNPSAAMRDLRNNKHMAVYGTYDGYGTEGITAGALADNPMLADTGLQWPDQDGVMRPVVANDLFRAVHDAFGHGLEGAGFRARGEENAWQAHVRLFTGPAVGAITSETRGQNSWLNYGPYGETNRTAKLEGTVFAEQKTGLMPEWTWTEGRVADEAVVEDTLGQSVAPTFYSALGRFVSRSGTARAPAAQWKGMIQNAPGIKAEEVEWTGVMEWLDLQQGPVTREALAQFVEANGVRVEEVVRGGGSSVSDDAQRRMLPLIERRDELQRELESEYYTGVGPDSMEDAERNAMFALEREVDDLTSQIDNLQRTIDLGLDDAMSDTKWSSYTLPGGENYREMLLTLPDDSAQKMKEYVEYRDALYEKYGKALYQTEASEQELQKLAELSDATGKVDPQFRSSHWSEPNVLAHVRFKERTGPNGERVLALEEIQSDWGQTGREQGFIDPQAVAAAIAEGESAAADRGLAFEDMKAALLRDDVRELVNASGTQREKDTIAAIAASNLSRNPMSIDVIRNAVSAHMRNPRLSEESRAALQGSYDAYRKATEAFDNAQRARSQSSRGVPNAPFVKNTSSWTELVLKRMIRFAAENGFDAVAWIPGNIQNGRVVDTDDNRGDFYDKIVPNAANKLGKKYGARVTQAPIDMPAQAKGTGWEDTGAPRQARDAGALQWWTLPITPELAAAAMTEGFPLFQPGDPKGWGETAPPPDLPPMRLDLARTEEIYGKAAVDALPKAIKDRYRDQTSVDTMLAAARGAAKTLKRKPPKSLFQFIRARKSRAVEGKSVPQKQWGIKGATDELKAMDRGDLINEASGIDIDYMRELAEGAGYLPENSTVNDLLNAIDREARGEPVYSEQDANEVLEIQSAQQWADWLGENGVDIFETDQRKLKAAIAKVTRTTNADLKSPDEAAELLGFETGEQLLKALAEAGSREKYIDAETDRRMREEFGDPFASGEFAEAARQAAESEVKFRAAEIEIEALARALGETAASKLAKEMAMDALSVMTVKELAGWERFLEIERREMRNAMKAVQAGDISKALTHKRRQLVNGHLAKAAREKSEAIEKTRKDLLTYFTSKGRRDKIARDYLDKIEALLETYELRKSKQTPGVQRKAMSAKEYVDQMVADGREAEIAPEAMLLAAQADKKVWRGLTVDEVEYLAGTVKNLAHLGRTKNSLMKAQDKRRFDAVVAELVDALVAAPTAKDRRQSFTPTQLEKLGKGLREFDARLTRLEFEFQKLDGRENGPLWNALFRPFAEAADAETREMRGAADRMRDLYEAFTASERQQLFHRRVSTPELDVPGKDMTIMDVVTIGLNWGNEGNRKALIDGYGWDPAAVEAVLNRVLTDKHWDFITGVWDLIGSYRDEAFALEKAITGVAPKAVEGIEFTLASGRTIKGKYYPLKYDGAQPRADSVVVSRLDEKQALSDLGKTFSKPMTKTGHLIERVGSGGKPVKLQIGVMHEHVQNVIHDIAYRRAVIDAHRIIRDPRFANAYMAAAGREQYDQLLPWLAAIATERNGDPGGIVTKLMQGLRRNMTIVAMGYKISTAVQQVTGPVQGMAMIGPVYTAQGFVRALAGGPASFWSAWKWVSAKSEFMRDRPQGYDRDTRMVTNRMQERTPLGAMQRNSMILTNIVDVASSTIVWIGAYQRAMDGNVENIGKGVEEDAIAYADSVVRQTQAAGRIQDLPQIMRGTETEKLVTMMYSYFSGLYNLTKKQATLARYGQMNQAAFTANLILLFVVTPLMAATLAGRMFDDEDDEEELLAKAGKEILSNATGTIPIFRDVAGATINPQFGYQMSPVGSGVDRLTKAAARASTGDSLESDAAVRELIGAMGILFGLPSGQLIITGDYVYDLAMGEEDPMADPADAASEALLRNKR